MEQNKKLLAKSLLEWTLGSKTTFNTAANEELQDKVKKLGISLPSPDLAAFETIYCELDKFNRNGVKLPKEVAERGIKTLIGKQLNWNHVGSSKVCGYIIDAFIKEDKIYIDGILFKSLFKDEFDEVIRLFENGELFVSFELWNVTESGETIIKDLGNGYRELTEMVAHGCALLLIDKNTNKPIPPACPVAQVQKLLASKDVIKEIQEAEEIVTRVFEHDERLVYAELVIADEEPKQDSEGTIEKGGKSNTEKPEVQMLEETNVLRKAKKLNMDEIIEKKEQSSEEVSQEKSETTPEEVKVEETAAQEEPVEDSKVEEKESEVASEEVKEEKVEEKTEETKEEVSEAEETKTEEPEKVEETIVETPKAEEAQVESTETTPEEVTETKETTPEENKEEASFECECLKCGKILSTDQHCRDIKCPECNGEMRRKNRPGSGNETAKETKETKVEEKVEEAVAEEVKSIDKKIIKIVRETTEVQTEQPNESGQSIERKSFYRCTTEYSDGTNEVFEEEREINEKFTKADLDKITEEKDKEIAKLKEELDKVNQEIESIKLEKAKAEEEKSKQPELTVGNILPTADRNKEIQRGIDNRAFGSRK